MITMNLLITTISSTLSMTSALNKTPAHLQNLKFGAVDSDSSGSCRSSQRTVNLPICVDVHDEWIVSVGGGTVIL